MGRFEGRARERETETPGIMREIVRATEEREVKLDAGLTDDQGPQVRTVRIVTRHRTVD